MKNIICKIKGHKFDNTNNTASIIDEYGCANCNQKFTTDGYGHLVKLNSFWKKNNLLFEKIIVENNTQTS